MWPVRQLPSATIVFVSFTVATTTLDYHAHAHRPLSLQLSSRHQVHESIMVKNGGVCFYKEARLNVEPAFPGSTIAFTLPTSSLSTFGSRTTAKRTIIHEQVAEQDEEAFSRRHLAIEGSMFFRQHHTYPRSFLWRVLDNRKMLEIQATDLEHDVGNKLEANLTLLFQFPSPLRPFCVAFAEPTDRDVLMVFAITTANELFTLTIPRDFFANPSASEQEIETWCRRSEPVLFSGRIPYRLMAVDADELLVSLDDGAICRMRWDKDSKTWDGSRYQHNNWSVRGLLSWKAQPTVRFDNADLAVSTATATALSPDKRHILSVCLDHSIRAWNVATGKPGAQMDLLGHNDHALEKNGNSYYIAPSNATLMAVVSGQTSGLGGADYHVITYSPKQHQFIFWGVRNADDQAEGFFNINEDADLVPPIDELMNTTVWTLDDFHFILGPAGWRGSEIWIRARSGPSSRVYSLKFDPSDDPDTLTQAWKNNWVSVDAGSLTVESLKSNSSNPSERDVDGAEGDTDIFQDWVDFLFYPARFTAATLETALVIYKKNLDQKQSTRAAKNKGSLKERICSTITTLAGTRQNGTADLDNFENAVIAQWQAYYGLVKDLHRRRGESLSLALDRENGLPWLVLSDHLSAIRSCSDAELASLNSTTLLTSQQLPTPIRKSLDKPDLRNVARLLNAAASFRQRLPPFVQQEVQRQIETDLLQSRSLTIIDRMEWVESHSEILRHVSDEDLSILVEELGMEVKDLSTDTFLRAIQTLGFVEEGRANVRKQIARFGLEALLQVSQENLQADHDTLLDLLVLVLFMFVELEGETPEEFDASEVFVELITQYKDCMTVSWLATTVWAHQSATGPASEALNRNLSESLKLGKRLPFVQTVFEGIYGQHAVALPLPKGTKTDLLTYWSRAWTALVFKEGNYDSVVEDTMGILLVQKEYDLALDFSKFLPEGNWATYLKGQLHIALGDYTLAALCFQKAAFHLGMYLSSLTFMRTDFASAWAFQRRRF